MSFRVLVVGGAGVFGKRLAEQLAATTDFDVVLGGRTVATLDAAVADLRRRFPGRMIEAAVLDKDRITGEQLRALSVHCVVDAAGPFQGAEPSLARTAIAAKAHYIDIADARDFVARFPTLDADAKEAGVLAVTGASSTPALSNAVLDRLTIGWRRVDDVEIAISPGNRAQRGLSVVEAIVGYAGKRVRVLKDGGWKESFGWGELIREDMPMVGRRWLSLCETPDLDVVPARFLSVKTAMFRAGVELSIFHLGLWLLSLPVRAGIVRSLAPIAKLLREVSQAFEMLGSDRGGMTVIATGVDVRGRGVRARWALVAEKGDGPYIPILPVVALLRRLAAGEIAERGARVSAGLLTLNEIEREFGRFAIRTQIEVLPGEEAPLFAQALGEAFETMPALVRQIHSPSPTVELIGEATVEGAENALGQLVARVMGFAAPGENIPAHTTIDRDGAEEEWTRHFGSSKFATHLAREGFRGLGENFGPIKFSLGIAASEKGYGLSVLGWRLGPMPLPRFLMPSTRASAGVDEHGRYTFDVWIGMPVIGRIVRYRGWLLERTSNA